MSAQGLTIEEVKKKYSSPSSFGDKNRLREWFQPWKWPYCVGGAFCLALVNKRPWLSTRCERFPTERTLADTLVQANPILSNRGEGIWPERVARYIVSTNEAGQFEQAWEYLRRGFAWDGKGNPEWLVDLSLETPESLSFSPVVEKQIQEALGAELIHSG